MKKIIIATKNAGKAAEFKTFFSKYNIKAISLLELDEAIDDIEETGTTFEENAAIKAEQIAQLLHTPVLADDSGLEVDALDGRPGVYSARYAGEPKDDQRNLGKLFKEMEVVDLPDRTARFVCVLAVAAPGESTVLKKGYCQGHIAKEAAGVHGFGYDPIFVPDGYTKTMAQLSPEEKNKISHRNNAIIQLEDWIRSIQ